MEAPRSLEEMKKIGKEIIARKTESAGYTIGEIIIGSEALESQDGRMRNVSTIEIEVKRNTS